MRTIGLVAVLLLASGCGTLGKLETKQGAANSLSRAHQAFAAHGYKVQSVEPYIENGDLQGFFVTYQKP